MIGVPYLHGADIKGRGERNKKRCTGSINTLESKGSNQVKERLGNGVSPQTSKPTRSNAGSGGLRRHVASQNSQMKGIYPSLLARGESHGCLTGASTHSGVSLPPFLPSPCGTGD